MKDILEFLANVFAPPLPLLPLSSALPFSFQFLLLLSSQITASASAEASRDDCQVHFGAIQRLIFFKIFFETSLIFKDLQVQMQASRESNYLTEKFGPMSLWRSLIAASVRPRTTLVGCCFPSRNIPSARHRPFTSRYRHSYVTDWLLWKVQPFDTEKLLTASISGLNITCPGCRRMKSMYSNPHIGDGWLNRLRSSDTD